MTKAAVVSPPKRIRRAPADLRAAALAAARRLIVEGSGDNLTMRAVADAIGVTYPNLSHHFGSAAGLHAAVAEDLVRELLAALRAIGSDMERPLEDPRRIVDVFFQMFDQGGLGRLVGWLARSGDAGGALRVHELIEEHLAVVEDRYGAEAKTLRSLFPHIALILSFTAYAESSAGSLLGEALGLTSDQRREIVAAALNAMRDKSHIDG